MGSEETRKALAAYAHEAWSGWMNYLLSKSTVNPDGTWTVPVWAAERWYRQMSTPYHLLPENEKDSDRAEADRMLAIVATERAALLARAQQAEADAARLRAALEEAEPMLETLTRRHRMGAGPYQPYDEEYIMLRKVWGLAGDALARTEAPDANG